MEQALTSRGQRAAFSSGSPRLPGAWLALGLVLVTCVYPAPIVHAPVTAEARVATRSAEVGGAPARHLVVFLDGTRSGQADRSNVYKLHELVVAQGRPDVLTFYVEGVGVGMKPVGSVTGLGIDYRLEKAYAFLLEQHRPGDRIHLFGFSRGAFAARILAAMLYFGGLPAEPGGACPAPTAAPDAGPWSRGCLHRVSRLVYRAYKGERSPEERIDRVRRALDGAGLRFARPVRVATLGLWDTVEALGLVDTWEAAEKKFGVEVRQDPGERNRRYGDQLCNVDRAFHALSIDDNRADVYTPKLLTLPHLFRNCEAGDPARDSEDFTRVEEVWFSGAHADVGGGYSDCEATRDCLSNVSLNWMVHLLVEERTGVLLEESPLEANGLSETHDGESGSLIYEREPRDVRALTSASRYGGSRPRIHCSVVERLARRRPRCHEYGWGFPRAECAEEGADRGRDACFSVGEAGLEYAGSRRPEKACSDETLETAVPGCWFTVVR